jgi:CheY-like chemotaxis protein
MERDLVASLARFVHEHSLEPVLVLSESAEILHMNAAAQATAVDFQALLASDPEEVASFIGELRARARARLEIAAGAAGIWQFQGTRVNSHFVVAAREVSAARDVREELRRLRRLAPLSLVAAPFVHDLAGALTPLLILSSRLTSEFEKGTRSEMMATEIHSSASMAVELIRELLPFARPQPASIECVDVNETLEESRPFIQRIVSGGCSVEVDCCAGSATVVVDRTRLRHAVLSLAALAASTCCETEHGGVVAFRTRIVGDGRTPEVVITMTKRPDAEQAGTGDGPSGRLAVDLASVRSFARDSGGRVTVGPDPSIALFLPHSATGERRKPAEGNDVVLVADRDERVRHALQVALGGRGYAVTQAKDEASALAAAARHPPRVAIVDTRLPARDPRTFVQSLLAIAPGMRIIFLADAPPSIPPRRERVALMSESGDDAIANLLRDALDALVAPSACRVGT